MTRIRVGALEERLSETPRAVEKGASVIVTDRERPIAALMRSALALVVCLVLAASCGGSSSTSSEERAASGGGESTAPVASEPPRVATVEPSAAVRAAVEAADRSAEDRALDEGRRPAEVMTFFEIEPGQRVADIFAGGGYTTELLARIVGAEGQVLAQNNAFVLERFARAPLAARLAQPHLAHVTAVERELDAPLPEDARELDAVIFVLAYHDSVWQGTDRAAMNRAIFAALRPGGVYGIVDHAAAPGSGATQTESLHRIEERVVIDEVLAAGFELDAELELLRNPDDTRDWNASPSAAGERRGTSDRFVLRFRRPR